MKRLELAFAGFFIFCVQCNASLRGGDKRYADLDGKPFTYLCERCAQEMIAKGERILK